MLPEPHVWVFHGAGARFTGGVFTSLDRAEGSIARHRLSGVLTAYPIDSGVFEWMEASGLIKTQQLAAKRGDPKFIGGFTSASQEHYHYEDGARVS